MTSHTRAQLQTKDCDHLQDARSTLLSLWRVGDQRTAVFMSEFYKRLKAGQPRADALRDTQAFFRKHPDSTYRDVYAWGGFQLTGDWRPVEGL